MAEPKFCCTCVRWDNAMPAPAEGFGICTDVGVSMRVALDSSTHMREKGTLWTDPYFGCIFWRPNNGSLIDINKIVKDLL